MTKYVAFLRGINVGGRIVKMQELQDCFRGMDFGEVQTVAQTGNVIFTSNESPGTLKLKIEAAVTKQFNFQAKIQVWSLAKLKKIIDAYPFGAAGASQHDYVIFMENGLEKAILSDKYSLADGEKVAAGAGVVYWRVDKGHTLRSSFGKTLARVRYKDFNTNRNIKTLKKLLMA